MPVSVVPAGPVHVTFNIIKLLISSNNLIEHVRVKVVPSNITDGEEDTVTEDGGQTKVQISQLSIVNTIAAVIFRNITF